MAADIGSSKVQADYDELARIASVFAQESSSAEHLMNQILSLVDQLESGGWVGRGAQAFYTDMHDQVEPGLRRLVQALEDASTTVNQINGIMSQAEQNAGSLFSRH